MTRVNLYFETNTYMIYQNDYVNTDETRPRPSGPSASHGSCSPGVVFSVNAVRLIFVATCASKRF